MSEIPISQPRHIDLNTVSGTYVIRGVTVWSATGVLDNQDVTVASGKILKIMPHSTENHLGPNDINGEGKVLLPAGIDVQTHLRVPGQFHKETPYTGLYAALRGGYAAVLTMPNTNPVLDSVETLELAREQVRDAEKMTGVKVLFSAAMTRGQAGREVVDTQKLAEAGIVAFTDDGKGVEFDEIMLQGFKSIAPLQIPFLQHAEVPGHGGVLAPSKIQAALKIAPYPASAEYEMVRRDLELLKKSPQTRYHVLHVSSAKTIELVEQARREGLRVSAEASPHHLYFCGDDINAASTAFKMNPPLRSSEDREALISALSRGSIDFMATDHAPHESRAKDAGFNQAPFGTTGLETALRVLIDLWQKKRLTAQRLVEVWALKPAQFLGLKEYGEIREGLPIRAVLADVEKAPSRVIESDIESLSTNNCFLNHPLGGKLNAVFLENEVAILN